MANDKTASANTGVSTSNVLADTPKKGSNTLKLISGVIIIVIIAAVAYYAYQNYFTNANSTLKESSAYLALQKTPNISTAFNILKTGFENQSVYNVSYSGYISFKYSVLSLKFPLLIKIQRYKNDTETNITILKLGSAIQSIQNPAGTQINAPNYSVLNNLNFDIYNLSNTYYICSGIAHIINNKVNSTCEEIKPNQLTNLSQYLNTASPTINNILNNTNITNTYNKIKSFINTSTTNYTLKSSNYTGSPCTMFSDNTNVNIALEQLWNSLSSSYGLPKITPSIGSITLLPFDINLASCFSNTYNNIPYNFSLSVNNVDLLIIPNTTTSPTINEINYNLSASINFKSNYLNNVVSEAQITTLPYKVVNISSLLQNNAGGGSGVNNKVNNIGNNLYKTVNVSCIAQNGFTCSNASYNNSIFSLNFNLSQTTFINGLNDPSAIYLNTTQAENFSKTNALPKSSYIAIRNVNTTFVNNTYSTHSMEYKIQYPVNINVFNFSNPINGEILVAYNVTGNGYCNPYVPNATGCTFIKAAIISK